MEFISVRDGARRRAQHASVHAAGHLLCARRVLPGLSTQLEDGTASVDDDGSWLVDAVRLTQVPTTGTLRALARVAYGGVMAERLVFGPDGVALDCAEDIALATRLLSRLACEMGAAPLIGLLSYSALDPLPPEAGAEFYWASVLSESDDAEREVEQILAGESALLESIAAGLDVDEPSGPSDLVKGCGIREAVEGNRSPLRRDHGYT